MIEKLINKAQKQISKAAEEADTRVGGQQASAKLRRCASRLEACKEELRDPSDTDPHHTGADGDAMAPAAGPRDTR